MKNFFLALGALAFFSCTNSKSADSAAAGKADASSSKADSSKTEAGKPTGPAADAATIMARPQVPVLCYHHIINAPKATREYDVTADQFRAQMKILADSGYHTILPDQLYDYLVYGKSLPSKPVMLTYDDTDEEQFSIAKPEMDKHGFKGVYFIMTISINRPRYMSKEQIKQLSDEGHAVESHTWRHDRVDRYLTTPHIDRDSKKMVANDWDLQLVDKRKQLEDITGKQIHYFAYPFGIWSKAGIPELRNRGFKLAFQLSTKRDPEEPLYTVRRTIVAPQWSPEGLLRVMKSTFGRSE
jgi:peptidoglycan/xylan/chitin deacetylase (PgdA/CDA1 family)